MAVNLLCNEISDLCIGKPPPRSLPATTTVGEALVALKLCGETFIGVTVPATSKAKGKASPLPGIAGKICMVDVFCFLCAEGNVSAPAAALKSPLSALLTKGEGSVRKVEANSSISEALDIILESCAETLVVPIRPSYTNKKLTNQGFCWLTIEDLVRFFLNNIFLFSSIASVSVTDLGLVSPDTLSVHPHDSAISALPLIRSALHDNTSVAVVTDDGKLIGEISPFTLSTCDVTVAAAIASLSAGDLMSYIDRCSFGGAPDSVVQAVKARLKDMGLNGMLEFLDDEELLSMSSSSSCSSSSASSSSDEEAEMAVKKRRPTRMRSGSYSARMGRRSEEAIVCHPESSLVAVMVQALAHRVSYVWVVDEDDYGLVGIVTFRSVLRVFRGQLL